MAIYFSNLTDKSDEELREELEQLGINPVNMTDGRVDKQVGGNHYQLEIQPIDYIMKNNLDYCEANVVKYVTRHEQKNGAEDIKKAIHYLEFILKYKYSEDN